MTKIYLIQHEEGFSEQCEGLTCYNISHDPGPHMICPDFSYTSDGEKYMSISCAFCGQHKRQNWGMKFV